MINTDNIHVVYTDKEGNLVILFRDKTYHSIEYYDSGDEAIQDRKIVTAFLAQCQRLRTMRKIWVYVAPQVAT